MSNKSEKLSDQLRGAVSDSGLSVNAVARIAGIPQPVLSRFMSNERGLSLESAEKLAHAFSMRLTKPTNKPKDKGPG